jgi:hypothetical protein
MGENAITLYFSLPQYVNIPLGAFCEYQGRRYTLENAQNFKKNGIRYLEYTLILDGTDAKLRKYMFVNTIDGKLKFSYNGLPHEHLQLVVDSLNRNDSGWIAGEYVDAPRQTIEYNFIHCSDALQMIADAFNTEWEVDGKVIHLRKVEYNKDEPLIVSYGPGNGIKPGIERTNYESKKQIQRLYVQGGERNIDFSKYGSNELLLPKGKSLIYNGRMYTSDENGYYITGQATTGNEDGIDLSHVYPSRVGTVSSVIPVDPSKNFFDFEDDSIPASLDFSKCLIGEDVMSVIFQDGMLAGCGEFEVNYSHPSRRFEIVPKDHGGQPMPNNTYKPAEGDKYAVFNVSLPDAYVENDDDQSGASWDMFREAARYLYENEVEQFSYTADLDGIWSKRDWLNIGGKLKPGGYVQFFDDQFEPDGALIRIAGIRDMINNPESPVVELSNSPVRGGIKSELNKIDQNEVVVEKNRKESIDFTKRRWRDAEESIDMLEAAIEGFSSGINPLFVKTMLMLVGDESLQFRFVDSKTTPQAMAHNVVYDASTKVLRSDAGILQHMTLGIAAISSEHEPSEYKFWDVASYTSPPLVDPAKRYYLYAKCEKDDTNGVFILSETAIGMGDVVGYYHLLVGILNSENNGDRSYVDLYGFTEVLPGRITTDKIVSSDGQTWFDLLLSEIAGRINFRDGIVSGDIGIGNESGINAGMNGAGNGDDDVRLWAGAGKEDKKDAPFRVMQDGSVVASKATIEGVINALSGFIGGFEIASGRIGSASSTTTPTNGMSLYQGFIKFKDNEVLTTFGTNVAVPSTGQNKSGRIEVNRVPLVPTSGVDNIGLSLSVQGCPETYTDAGRNVALEIAKGHLLLGNEVISVVVNVAYSSSSNIPTRGYRVIRITGHTGDDNPFTLQTGHSGQELRVINGNNTHRLNCKSTVTTDYWIDNGRFADFVYVNGTGWVAASDYR